MPVGGRKLSGVGREFGVEAIDDFLETKSVMISIAKAAWRAVSYRADASTGQSKCAPAKYRLNVLLAGRPDRSDSVRGSAIDVFAPVVLFPEIKDFADLAVGV